jgi:putative ABC transport system permease protein
VLEVLMDRTLKTSDSGVVFCHNPFMLTGVLQDITISIRQLRRSPTFTVAAIVTLALAIGATTSIFTLVDGILLRPLPLPEPDGLVAINTLEFPPGTSPNGPQAGYAQGSSYPDFFDWQGQNHTFESISSYEENSRLFSKSNGDGAQVIHCGRVSANLFSTLGVAPELGRTFSPEEEKPGHRVVILSHELWVSAFGSSRDVIGQVVNVSHEPSIIVGVMPSGFHYPVNQPALFWATYAANTEGPFPITSIREDNDLNIVGRLKPGVTMKQALADLNTIQRQLAQQYPVDRNRSAVLLRPLLDEQVEDIRGALTLLSASVSVVLLIGCANVAGLLLARATSRRSELALRTSLGASRVRIIRQLLIESLLLALGGGLLGFFSSIAFVRVGIRLVPGDVPRLFNVSIDARVLLFAVALSCATAVVFGLLPALRNSRSDPAHFLRDRGITMTSGRKRNRLHYTLVVFETALGFALLIGSGLLIKSMMNLFHLCPGFDTSQTLHFDVALTQARYPDPSKVEFYKKLLPELERIPGVIRVSAGHPMPGGGGGGSWNRFSVAGHADPPDNLPSCTVHVAMPGLFETVSIPLLWGRTFTERDNLATAPPVAIVNRAFVRKFLPNEDPIGHYLTPHFEYSTEPIIARQIIGVVGDTLSGDPWEDPYQPDIFLPYAQYPTHPRPRVIMKVSGDPISYRRTIQEVAKRIDPEALVFDYGTFSDRVGEVAMQPRFEAALVSAFAAIALVLSAVGLYAVLAYIVAERTRELGLRIAFGASRSDILVIVLWRALSLTLLGVLAGAGASLLFVKLVSGFLFRVQPLDASTFATVTLTLLSVSVFAALAPAIRAAWVNPIRTLREQ